VSGPHVLPGVQGIEGTDSPELSAAMRLLDDAKSGGFTFERIRPGTRRPAAGCAGNRQVGR
jgi:hypothetical protein